MYIQRVSGEKIKRLREFFKNFGKKLKKGSEHKKQTTSIEILEMVVVKKRSQSIKKNTAWNA